jgi:hypothetical protein
VVVRKDEGAEKGWSGNVLMEGGTKSLDGGRDPKFDDLMEGGTQSRDGGRDPKS